MKEKSFDKFILLLYFFSIVNSLYFSALSQSNEFEGKLVAPKIVLLLPFAIVILQLLRILFVFNKSRIDSLGRTWLYILIMYLFVFINDFANNVTSYNYNTYWFVVCPPVAWVYYSLVFKENPSLSDLFIKLGFWLLVLCSAIFLYFVPLSIRDNDYFSRLNTGYYALMAYPLAMLSSNRKKQIISTALLLVVVLLTMKRGAILAIFLSFMLYFVLSSNKNIGKKIILLFILAVSIMYIVPIINEYSNGTLYLRYEQQSLQEDGRYSMYTMILNALFQSSPIDIVLGHGHNAVMINKVAFGFSAHNDYLEFLYDYGVIGFILLLRYQCKLCKITRLSFISNTYFLSTIFAFTCIVVLSMVSVVYAYYYFLIIIPFWCMINNHLNMIIK